MAFNELLATYGFKGCEGNKAHLTKAASKAACYRGPENIPPWFGINSAWGKTKTNKPSDRVMLPTKCLEGILGGAGSLAQPTKAHV